MWAIIKYQGPVCFLQLDSSGIQKTHISKHEYQKMTTKIIFYKMKNKYLAFTPHEFFNPSKIKVFLYLPLILHSPASLIIF